MAKIIKTKQQSNMLAVLATLDFDGIRTADLKGVEHTVIPCVCLVEGVLWPSNAESPELALAEEFGRFPAGWNGRPVVLGHPKVDGSPVAANTPGVLEEFQIGQLFNTTLDGKKLKTEIWIDMPRVAEMGEEAALTVERLLGGTQTVEVSTGMFTMSEQIEGTFEGTKFNAIWRNIVPDHLAILPEGTIGACSVEDGCGAPRTMEFHPAMAAGILIDTETHEHSAPEDCVCGGVCDRCKELVAANDTHVPGSAFSEIKEALIALDAHDSWLFTNKKHKPLSDRDVRAAVGIALSKAVEDDMTFVTAIFQTGEGTGIVVYEKGFDVAFFERTFEIAGTNGTITLGSKITEVRPETQFVPINVTVNAGTDTPEGEENDMSKEDRVAALIANEATNYTETDKSWLLELEDGQLESMEPVEAPDPSDDNAGGVEGIQEQQAEGSDDNDDDHSDHSVTSLEDHLKTLPQEVRAQVEEGIRIQKARKATLIKSITENDRNEFTAEQLQGMEISVLQNIAKIGDLPDYSGNDIGQGDESRFVDNAAYTPAPKFLEALKKDAA